MCLRQAFAILAEQQPVVVVNWPRPIHQGLKQDLYVRCLGQVLAPYDICDALNGIIMSCGKVVGCRTVLAGERNIPMDLGASGNVANSSVLLERKGQRIKEQRAHLRACRLQRQAPGKWHAGGQPGVFLRARHRPGSHDSVGKPRTDLLAGQKTAVDESSFAQTGHDAKILIEVAGLATHRSIPAQSEPFKILANGDVIFRPAAGDIDILDPQQRFAIRHIGRAPYQNGGQGMAEMQGARGRGSKAGAQGRHGRFIDGPAACVNSPDARNGA